MGCQICGQTKEAKTEYDPWAYMKQGEEEERIVLKNQAYSGRQEGDYEK